MVRITRLMLGVIQSAFLVGCGGQKKLSIEPCAPTSEVVRASAGFDPDDYDMIDFDEHGAYPSVWSRIEVTDGGTVLAGFDDLPVGVSIYRDRIAEFWVLPRGLSPTSELGNRMSPMIESLRRAGFELVEGQPETLLDSNSGDLVKHVTFRRGDYEALLRVDLDSSRQYFEANFVFSSVDTCRSPAIKARMAELQRSRPAVAPAPNPPPQPPTINP